jgi:predicted dehydrogenase
MTALATVRPTEELAAVLVVGCGEHARDTLVPALVSLGRARLVGVCDTDEVRAHTLAHRFAVVHVGRDLHRMIDELRPDAVVMAGPPVMHIEGGLHALEAGCHLLVEKPPAPGTDGLQKLAAAAADTGVTGMVGHNLRHTAAWRRMHERVPAQGIASMVVTYHASGPIGGRWDLPPLQAFLLTHAVHVLDLFNAALGPPASTSHHIVDAGSGRYVLTSQWMTSSGVVGTAIISTCAPRLDWQVRIATSDGTLADITSPREVEIQGPRTAGPWAAGHRDRWRSRSLDAGYDTAGYGAELHHFLDCIDGTATPAPSFTEELAVYQALDDLYAQTGHQRNVVSA